MTALLWRDLASSHRHFTWAVEVFDELRDAPPGKGQYLATMGFVHAMQSGFKSFEAGLKRLRPP